MEDIRKCKSGYGTRFIVISLRSTFNAPSNLIEQVIWLNKWAIKLFILSNGFYLFSSSPNYVIFMPTLPSWAFSFTNLALLGLSI